LANQAHRLAALLALRQLGSQQYFWCLALRGSARNNFLQDKHLGNSERAIDPPSLRRIMRPKYSPRSAIRLQQEENEKKTGADA
jgi:hypothetical protein